MTHQLRLFNDVSQIPELKKLIADAAAKIRQIQEDCEHPNVKKVAKADTGNWCPQDDSYWYECKCPDCGKWWTEDQ